MVVVSFALTTLDSATRLLRYNIEELSDSLGLPAFLQHRVVASGLAVLVIAVIPRLRQARGRTVLPIAGSRVAKRQ